MWLFALAFSGISVPVVLLGLPQELAQENWAALAALLFPLIGLWLAYHAVLKTLEWRRFGRLYLDLDPFPGSLGGDVGGRLELPIVSHGDARFDVTLSCVHSRVSGHGNNRSRHEAVIWRGKAAVAGEPGISGTRVRFRFAVPNHLPQSEPVSDNYHYWAVHLRAVLPGVDLDRAFEVPVFATDQPIHSRSRVPYAAEVAAGLELPGNIVRVYRGGDGLRLDYPASRSRGVGLFVLLFGLIFLGAPMSMALVEGLPGVMSSSTAFAGFGFLAAVFAVVGLATSLLGLYLLGNSLQVQISGRGVSTRRRLFGMPLRSRFVSGDQVRGIEHGITMQSGQGARATVRYTVSARLGDGGSLCLGDGIKGRPLVDQVLGLIREAGEFRSLPTPGGARQERSTIASKPETMVRARRSAHWLGVAMAIVLIAVFASDFLDMFGR